MGRSELLERIARDRVRNSGAPYAHWGRLTHGEALWNVITSLGVDLRSMVGTPSDPWPLTGQGEIERWIDRHILFDDDGAMLRVNLNIR